MREKQKSSVTLVELRRLLTDLKEMRPDISIRYRLLGEMWVQNFRRVILVTENGVLFNDEEMNKLIGLPDLAMVMQFEIDHAFQDFQPHFHYNVESSAQTTAS